jgi:hypothetical protein
MGGKRQRQGHREALVESRQRRRQQRRTAGSGSSTAGGTGNNYRAVDPEQSRLARDLHQIARFWHTHPPQTAPDDHLSYEQMLAIGELIGPAKHSGFSADELDALPFHRARPDECGECAICLCLVEAGNFVIILECGHRFHSPCIRRWLGRKASCPVCRVTVPHPPIIIDS